MPVRKRKRIITPDGNWTDRAACKIAGAGIRLQTKFAKMMNQLTSNLPRKKLKFILVAFCVISGGFSIYLAGHAVFGKSKNQPTIKIEQMNTPRHFDKTGSEINEPENTVPEDLYRDIQEYKHYMDSLGQPIRPGLRDSIQILEQIYHSQKIK
jgi:hypothetical protein